MRAENRYGWNICTHPQGWIYAVAFRDKSCSLKNSELLAAWWPNGERLLFEEELEN